MLPELMAANAAFAVIKQTIANGKDLLSAGQAISDFVNAQEDLRNKGHKKKNSVFGSDDLSEFMALEQIKEQEQQLKELMIWSGRAGLWNDWLKFQADARKERQRVKQEQERKRRERIELIQLILAVLVVAGGIGLLLWWMLWLRGQ